MSKSNYNESREAVVKLLKSFGIDKPVTKVVLTMAVDTLPTLDVTYLVVDGTDVDVPEACQVLEESFQLVPASATASIQETINQVKKESSL